MATPALPVGRFDEIIDGAPLDAAELRGVNLEAKIVPGWDDVSASIEPQTDGDTPLELCLGRFCDLAVGDDSDCHVCGVYELAESVITLLDAGAVLTPRAMKIIGHIVEAEHSSFGELGASQEVSAVLSCVTTKLKMLSPAQ